MLKRRLSLVPVAVGLAATMISGCGNSSRSSDTATPPQKTTQVNEDPYVQEDRPYAYSSPVQKEVVASYVACMAKEGVQLRGPYLDYKNTGMVFKAEGQPVPLSALRAAGKKCPQDMLAVFLDGASDDADMEVFRRASIQFAN